MSNGPTKTTKIIYLLNLQGYKLYPYCSVGIMQVQMPVEKPQHHDHVQALEQAMASISQEDLDKSSLMEIEDETHPLAPVHLPAPPEEEEEGTSRREPPARESVSNSSSSVFQGQNFTHMYGLYAQPIVIDVPDEDEEAKGIEVSCSCSQ